MINKGDNFQDVKRGQIIYKGQCIDSNDPMRLGRIRAILRTENTQDRELANENSGKQTYVEWGEKDPFVFKPLLPFFINTPPKENEYVHLFYNNITRKGDKDKFYIGGVYSSPTTSKFEKYDSAVTNFDEGSRNKPFEDILDESREKYRYSYSEGVYSEPEDVALYGRGSCDIVIKDNTVLLRAGKNKNFERGQIPRKNDERAFIQLSKFDYRTLYGSPSKKFIFSFKHEILKKLVEYTLINPENNSNLFMGEIYIYNLARQDGLSISTADININKVIPESSKSLQTKINFEQKKMSEVIKLINDVLEGVVKGSIQNVVDEDTVGISINGPQKFDKGNTFPFYFRPQLNLYNKLGGITPSSNMQENYNISSLLAGVKIKTTDLSPGYSLVYDDKKTDTVPFKPVSQELIPKKTERYNKSVGVMGSDEIYLLSHTSKNPPNKERIDLSNTLYGINENMVADIIEPNTSSLVRGEELLELLNLIVRFLVSHVHPWHGTTPVPTSFDGTKVDDILKELLNAQDKILNKKIRIN
jgi:hypothetical protein